MVKVKVKKYLGSHNIYGELLPGTTVDVSEKFYERYEDSLTKVSGVVVEAGQAESEKPVEITEPTNDTDNELEDENKSEVTENE